MQNLVGQRFGRLTVLRFSHKKNRKPYYICQCDCGNTVCIDAYKLLSGTTVSCSCFHRELVARMVSERNFKHGMCGTRLYSIWKTMIKRCCNPNHISYSRYGQRGISVCSQWKSFIGFMEWAVANGYSESLTIDRIDNDKGYAPDNCRWTTMLEQENHRTNNHYLEFEGEQHTIAEWSRITNIPYGTIYTRLKKGLPISEVLKTKIAPADAANIDKGASKNTALTKYTNEGDLSNVST